MAASDVLLVLHCAVLLCAVNRFEQVGGKVQLEFERPTDGSSSDSMAMAVNSPVRLIVARGPGNDFGTFDGYHG